MKSQTILQYLSTVSDTFMVVAFGALVSLPFAIGLGAQPVRDQVSNQPATVKKATTAQVTTNSQKKVLGVEDVKVAVQSPAQNVDVQFLQSQNTRNFSIDSSSATTGEYSIDGSVRFTGSYSLIKLTNKNSTPVTLNLSLAFLDNKSTVYNINAGTQSITFVKNTDNTKNTVTINPNSDVTLSVNADSLKSIGSFKLVVKFS